jgi:hypothetical protein
LDGSRKNYVVLRQKRVRAGARPRAAAEIVMSVLWQECVRAGAAASRVVIYVGECWLSVSLPLPPLSGG